MTTTDVRLKLRDVALTFPEAWEDHPWGEIVIKVRKKVFVFFGNDEFPGMTVKLADPVVREHALSLRGASLAGYGLGRSGWVSIPLQGKAPPRKLLSEFLEESYRAVAPKSLAAGLDNR